MISSVAYSASMPAQSVSSGLAARACSAAIAAWTWYGPGSRFSIALSIRASPSPIILRFQRLRS